MKKIDNTYKVELKKDLWQYAIPFIIWIMICIIPTLMAIQYSSKAIKQQNVDKAANNNSLLIRNNLKLQNDLKPTNFLNDVLQIDKLAIYSNAWRDKKEAIELNKHLLLKNAPTYNSINEQTVLKLAKAIKKLIGINASVIMTFSDKKSECKFLFQKPFRLKIAKFSFIESMQQAYTDLNIMTKNMIPKEETSKDISAVISKKHLGVQEGIFSFLYFNRIRFSSITNSTIQFISLPITFKGVPPKFILLGIDMSKLDPLFILKKCVMKYNRDNLRVKFGYSEKNTPYYYKNSSETILLGALPIELKSLLINKASTSPNTKPVTRLSISSTESETSLKFFLLYLKRLFFPIAFLMLIAIRHTFSPGKKISGNSLKQTIFTGIYFSALIPIIFGSFFWLIHSQIEQNNKNNRIMEFMDAKVREIDLRMNNSRNRFLMYTNYKALEASKQKTSDNVEKLFKRNWSKKNMLHLSYNLISFFTSLNVSYTISQKLDISNSKATTGILSIVKGFLVNMNFFSLLHRKQIKKIQLQNDTSIAAISELVSIPKIRSLLKNLGEYASKLFDTSKIRTIAHLISLNKAIKSNLFLMFIARPTLIDFEFRQQFLKKEMDKVFNKYGFDVRFYIYQTGTANADELAVDHYQFMGKKAALFKYKAISLYANQKNIRQINLENKTEPNIIFARPIANNEYFAIGYAVPKSISSTSPFFKFITIGIIVSLLTTLFIAWSVTSMLLLPIPPTLEAISELNKNNFAWELQVNSGDELSLLHKSFNSLSLQMLERNKMQQLVSEDIAEMISVGSMQLNEEAKSIHTTVLFSDIRGFTTISEKYNAEDVVSMLNEYFTLMVGIIKKHDGKVNQLIGDAIQAVFYDNLHVPSAIRASVAAIEMRLELQKLNDARTNKGLYTIANGIGLSTGDVITGIVGSNSGRLDSTLIGDTVLLAEELEGLSKYAKKSFILVDKTTAHLIKNQYSIIEFNSNEVDTEVKIFEIDKSI